MLLHSSLTARHRRVSGARTRTQPRFVCASSRRTRAMITRTLIITVSAAVAGACSSNPGWNPYARFGMKSSTSSAPWSEPNTMRWSMPAGGLPVV